MHTSYEEVISFMTSVSRRLLGELIVSAEENEHKASVDHAERAAQNARARRSKCARRLTRSLGDSRTGKRFEFAAGRCGKEASD
jgi:hypothetical protein